MAARIDEFGTPEAYNHYAVGWAHAMDTPYQWTKQVASHWGGTRNGTIVHWPNGIQARGEIRHQFHHVIDVAPDHPRGRRAARADFVQRRPAGPLHGVSMAYSFDDADAPERHETQYFEMFVQPRHLPQGLDGGDPAQHALGACVELPGLRRRRVGAVRPRRLDPGPRPRRASSPTSCAELQRLFLIEATRSTTCCRSTTGGSSGSTPTWPAGRTLIHGQRPRSCSAAWAG